MVDVEDIRDAARLPSMFVSILFEGPGRLELVTLSLSSQMTTVVSRVSPRSRGT